MLLPETFALDSGFPLLLATADSTSCSLACARKKNIMGQLPLDLHKKPPVTLAVRRSLHVLSRKYAERT